MRMFGLKFYEMYKMVFDHNVNPLRHIPDPASRLLIMTILAVMWSGAFATYIGSLVYFAGSVVGHILLLAMVFFTASVFYDAEKRGDSWLLMLKRRRQIPPVQDRRCKWDLEREG
jgi:hypothetical protein